MNLFINGELRAVECEGSPNLAQILEELEELKNLKVPFAVAVNRNFIPKSFYQKTILSENDGLEILSPQAGG